MGQSGDANGTEERKMAEHEIIMNFKRTRKEAAKLDEAADSLQQLADGEFEDSLQNVSAGWKGENADIFLKKGRLLKAEIMSTARQMRKTAGTIRSIANRTFRTEMEALKTAQTRSM